MEGMIDVDIATCTVFLQNIGRDEVCDGWGLQATVAEPACRCI